MVRSSTEFQIKFFPGCSFKGYTSVDAAITAWDLVIANNVVGPVQLPITPSRSTYPFMPANSRPVVLPSTPPRQAARTMNPIIPLALPSTPPRQAVRTTVGTPSISRTTGGPLETPSQHVTVAQSSGLSMPSAHGSEARLAAIIAAMSDIDLSSHYVVIHGIRPGSLFKQVRLNLASFCYC